LSEPFSDEKELAFFVVNIGLSITEFLGLTEKQKMFIRKEFELKIKREAGLAFKAMSTALFNVYRKKNKAAMELWDKPKTQKALIEFNEQAIETVQRMEKENGKSWVDKVLKGG